MQLVLVFPTVFWPEDVEVLNRVAPWPTPGAWSETYSLLPHTGGAAPACLALACGGWDMPLLLGHACAVRALVPARPTCRPASLPAGKPVLVAFNAAQYAVQLERKAPAQVKGEYMAVLRAMFGAANVPEPISVRPKGGLEGRGRQVAQGACCCCCCQGALAGMQGGGWEPTPQPTRRRRLHTPAVQRDRLGAGPLCIWQLLVHKEGPRRRL